ncbi:hypothetical protein Cgig2_010229 [Carnegiea gigantea]|uniref:Polygalacturonase n=1 Tax=Carnegiea gigantea TaxID=171969 RepID=A0A9Q1Q8M8_9CARY|nr:hypothetical protein Cgig2_010229 [Carnegiea gigantea]
MNFKFVVLFVLVYLLSSISHLHGAFFDYNVMDSGAKCDGKTNDRRAFISTWREACKSTRPSTMAIPARNCVLGPVEFEGPWKATNTSRVEVFKNIDQLTILGSGTFDGQGRLAWKNNNCAKTKICNLPANCRNMDLKNIVVDASIMRLNTNGIYNGRSNKVNITEVDINTGDDCISLGDGR